MTPRALLDTNILIHREGRKVVRDDIGTLFRWLEELKYERLVHPDSVSEVRKHQDPEVVRTIERKLESYKALKTKAPDTPGITQIRAEDTTENDKVDTSMLAEVAADRVDFLITEDRGLHRKAARLGFAGRVFTIDAFLEKVTAENPGLADYKVLSVKKELFGNVDVAADFFESFRTDYPGFDGWFNRKADETAYVCRSGDGEIVAFLYLKREGADENYGDIEPPFRRAQRLKIGTLKVVSNGFKLGERFLKIVFDNALRHGVIDGIPDLPAFLAACRKRSVFTDKELQAHWDYSKSRPFVVNFLFIYSLPKRPTLEKLDGIGFVKASKPPRGFARVSDESFEKLLQISNADTRFIVR
jgi:hypothetical protein